MTRHKSEFKEIFILMPIKPLIFDLDDTLYPEIMFVEGGFRAVARHLNKSLDLSEHEIYSMLLNILRREGRGSVFDKLLRSQGKYSQKSVQHCVRIYRSHKPNLKLYDAAVVQLASFKKEELFLVTDGNKIVQASKVESLGLNQIMAKVFITHRFGIANAKPSIHCFQIIKKICGCSWIDMTYVGDNPKKDFVNLKPLGVHTVRVKTGYFTDHTAPFTYDADVTIDNLSFLNSALKRV